jgi:predicted transcriptional regulator
MAQNSQLTSIQEKALTLLGNGVSGEAVAAALGVTPSAISQLISNPEFAEQIATLRYENLQKHNDRDNKYDSMEDRLLAQLDNLLPLMMKPLEVLRAIQVINAAKRRGASTPDSIINKQTTINLVMPTQIIQKFSTNVNNQVITAGETELLTIDSKSLLEKVSKQDDARIQEKVRTITHAG